MAKDLEKAKKRIRMLVPTKNNPMYNSHMYWSQKSFNVCDVLIEELSEKGEVVFDPFMGSGVTILESIKNQYQRKAIGCEINEAPLSIVKTLIAEYDLSEYHVIAAEIVEKICKFRSYYNTCCPQCGKTADITTTLFDLENRGDLPRIKKINAVCPNCGRIEKTNCDFSEDLVRMIGPYSIYNIATATMLEDSKLAVYKDETIDQIFTKRNYKVVDEILSIFKEYPKYEALMKYILMSVLHLCKITDTHSNSQWPLWIPKKDCVEKNVTDIICKKIKKFEDTITFLNNEYNEREKCILLHKGSQNITQEDIKDESVSLIVTDPPYLGQVAYSEYMQLYKPFLGLDFNLQDEIIVTSTPQRKITEEQYFDMLDQVFAICDAKMKEGGYFCMYFHDCNLNVWNQIITIMAKNHFKYLSQEHIKKTNTLKNIISPKKSLSGDAILFFVKDRIDYKAYDPQETFEEIEKNVIHQVIATVKRNGKMTTPELYDNGIIEYLVYNGWLDIMSKKYKTLVELFEKCLIWDSETNRWGLQP